MVRTTPDDDYDRKLLADVKEHGWHLVGISDDDDEPAYVFSVGMFHTLAKPEVCIFGLRDIQVMGQIVNGIGDMLKSGENFEDWDASDEVLDGYSCIFRQVDRQHYPDHFGYARWFYEGDEFPMLQCVWPDGEHCFPWDSDFNARLVESQPVLATKSAWPFLEAKNTAAITTRQVIEDDLPILLVSHDEDGDWQFLCGTSNESDDGRVVSLKHIVETYPSVAELADLPMGWQAFRDEPDGPWQRAKQN
jgi:hypothetical protein